MKKGDVSLGSTQTLKAVLDLTALTQYGNDS